MVDGVEVERRTEGGKEGRAGLYTPRRETNQNMNIASSSLKILRPRGP